jgi:hypothetical protein
MVEAGDFEAGDFDVEAGDLAAVDVGADDAGAAAVFEGFVPGAGATAVESGAIVPGASDGVAGVPDATGAAPTADGRSRRVSSRTLVPASATAGKTRRASEAGGVLGRTVTTRAVRSGCGSTVSQPR